MIYTEDAFLLSGQRSLKGFVAGLRPAAWFQFGRGITIGAAGVSQWDDTSGNGRHLLQATDTNQPAVQADGSILFDGADNFLKCDAFTLNQPATGYILFKQITWTSLDTVFDGNSNDDFALIQSGSSPNLAFFAGAALNTNPDLALDTYGVISCVANGVSGAVQTNLSAAVDGNSGADSPAGFTLGSRGGGADRYANIQVKEVIVYAAAHDAATRARVIRYLMTLGQI